MSQSINYTIRLIPWRHWMSNTFLVFEARNEAPVTWTLPILQSISLKISFQGRAGTTHGKYFYQESQASVMQLFLLPSSCRWSVTGHLFPVKSWYHYPFNLPPRERIQTCGRNGNRQPSRKKTWQTQKRLAWQGGYVYRRLLPCDLTAVHFFFLLCLVKTKLFCCDIIPFCTVLKRAPCFNESMDYCWSLVGVNGIILNDQRSVVNWLLRTQEI